MHTHRKDSKGCSCQKPDARGGHGRHGRHRWPSACLRKGGNCRVGLGVGEGGRMIHGALQAFERT